MAQPYQSIKSLTPKQEKFCLLVSSGCSNSEAYRDAYRAEKMLPDTVHRSACQSFADKYIEAVDEDHEQ